MTILFVFMAFASSAYSQEKAFEWDLPRLDTARTVGYLSDAEKDVVLLVNKLRTNPSAFADQYLVPQRTYYSGKIYAAPGKVRIDRG